MARGVTPKPTALKLVQGVKDYRINDDEPQPGEGVPDCPSKRAAVRQVWDYTVVQLQKMRVITMADRDLLITYCTAVVQFREATEILAKEGMIIQGSHGGLVKHPAQGIQREAAGIIKSLGQEFGLSPSARTRIKVGDQAPKQESGAQRLLSG